MKNELPWKSTETIILGEECVGGGSGA